MFRGSQCDDVIMAKKPKEIETVSFKIGRELYEDLEKYSKTLRDTAGLKQSPAQAARHLVIESLKRLKK